MARLIDADALKKAIMAEPWKNEPNAVRLTVDYINIIIDEQPTVDAGPVVRCKDCKNWGGVAFGNVCRRWSAPLAGMKNCTGPNDFCSYGERKEND